MMTMIVKISEGLEDRGKLSVFVDLSAPFSFSPKSKSRILITKATRKEQKKCQKQRTEISKQHIGRRIL